MADLAQANKRFLDGAKAKGLAVEIVRMAESTRTAEDAAAACGCDVAQIVKSLVFQGRTSKKPYLFMVSGKNRVNETGIAERIGEELIRPDAAYVRDVTGYAIGGIPPLAHKEQLCTFVDQTLFDYDIIWAAAGTPKSVFSTTAAALSVAANARTIDVT